MQFDDRLEQSLDLQRLLANPRASAMYLTEALGSGGIKQIAGALFDIQSVHDANATFPEVGYNLRLAEMFEILKRAGLRLVAIEDLSRP